MGGVRADGEPGGAGASFPSGSYGNAKADFGDASARGPAHAASGTGRGNGSGGQKSVGWLLFGVVFVLVLFFIIIRRYIPKGNFPLYLQKNLERYGLKSPKWLRDWARWSGLSSLERSFEEINRSLQRLGVHVPASATPAERAQRLIEALPEAREAIEELLAEYQAAVYGKVTGHVRRAQRAAQHIRYAAWKRRYFHFM